MIAQQARRAGDTLLAEGTIRVGCVDARNFPAAPHPDDISILRNTQAIR